MGGPPDIVDRRRASMDERAAAHGHRLKESGRVSVAVGVPRRPGYDVAMGSNDIPDRLIICAVDIGGVTPEQVFRGEELRLTILSRPHHGVVERGMAAYNDWL